MDRLSLSEHKQIVDAYIALGYDLDTIAIAKGFYQPDAAEVLKGYNFRLGHIWGDDGDDRGKYKFLPQSLVNMFVESFYPGNAPCTITEFLEQSVPDWRNFEEEPKGWLFSRRLTPEEKRIMKASTGKDGEK